MSYYYYYINIYLLEISALCTKVLIYYFSNYFLEVLALY